MYCRNCGTRNEAENAYCRSCGALLSTTISGKRKKKRKYKLLIFITALCLLIGTGSVIYLKFFTESAASSITDDGIGMPVISDGTWIYFSNAYDNQRLYRMKSESDSVEKICDTPVERLVFLEDWIYYTSPLTAEDDSSPYAIGRIKKDGSDNTLLYNSDLFSIASFAVSEDTIYITAASSDDEPPLLQILSADPQIGLLYDDSAFSESFVPLFSTIVSVDTDYLYILSAYETTNMLLRDLYRIKPDGSEKEYLLNDLVIAYSIDDSIYCWAMTEASSISLLQLDKQTLEQEELLQNINTYPTYTDKADLLFCELYDETTEQYITSSYSISTGDINALEYDNILYADSDYLVGVKLSERPSAYFAEHHKTGKVYELTSIPEDLRDSIYIYAVFDGWAYTLKRDEGATYIYRIKLDGTDLEFLGR